jgi:hypothetical protein
MARIAIGAALENMRGTARHLGCEIEPVAGPALATLRCSGGSNAANAGDDAVARRVTNRRLYDGQPVAADVLSRLTQLVGELDGARAHWIVDHSRLGAWAGCIARADATMFGEASMRRAFLANVRFDQAADAAVDEGLSLASLELSTKDRVALRVLRWLPDWLVKAARATQKMAAHTHNLVQSASGLCLITAADGTPAADLAVGQLAERAWLALTAAGFAVQPMMSLLVLENARDHGTPQLQASIGPNQLQALGDEFKSLMPDDAAGRRPGFLMRFGHAPAASGRTGRRGWQVVTTIR